MTVVLVFVFFFFNDTATTEIYTLSLHDALPISRRTGKRSWSPRWISRASKKYAAGGRSCATAASTRTRGSAAGSSTRNRDRKSTRLNSSHGYISYAVFCLKKKKHGIIERGTGEN